MIELVLTPFKAFGPSMRWKYRYWKYCVAAVLNTLMLEIS